MKTQTIVFGGGCFWCTEAVFQRLKGVVSVSPGYSNGQGGSPSYEEVSTGTTGYAEVARVEYDPSEVELKTLLAVFFSAHDPTTLNRQGADVGTQYRSGVYYTSEDQKKETEHYIEQLKIDAVYPGPIVTEVLPLENYYPAEEYHKNYYSSNPAKPYCQLVIDPKIAKLRKQFQQYLR